MKGKAFALSLSHYLAAFAVDPVIRPGGGDNRATIKMPRLGAVPTRSI